MSSDEKNNQYFNGVASSLVGSNQAATLAVAGAALAGGALYYYLNSSQQHQQQNSQAKNSFIDFKHQSQVDENGDIYNVLCKNASANRSDKTTNVDYKLLTFYREDVKTLRDLFVNGAKITKKEDGRYLGWKPSKQEPYKWITYDEAEVIVEKIGSAFVYLGLKSVVHNEIANINNIINTSASSFVGIFAKNRKEWALTEQACNAYSFVSVPLYDTLGDEAISFILTQTEMKLVVCDDSTKALSLMDRKSNLEHVIIIDAASINDEVKQKAAQLNIRVTSFDDIQQLGKENPAPLVAPHTDSLATICYTSGTTGTPKGAMITHKNMISIVSSFLIYLRSTQLLVNGNESYLSYLPLAHMFERISQACMVGVGGRIGFYQGDIKLLIDDMKELKPTVFTTVPRLLNRVYAKIQDNIAKSSPFKRAIFNWAFRNKEREVLHGVVRKNSLYDFAFKQIRQGLGGETKFIITGSAPISAEILHFLRVVTGCHVIEGYGATETGGATSVQIPYETTVGNVGPPFMCSKFRLKDVPEMNLDVERDGRGELLIAGNNVFKGYFKDEEKTRAALTEDGWYHTGDIAEFEVNGTLKIVDRVKNIFKLQQGEYIAPEKIENIYVRSKYVAQVFIYGNSYKSSLIGVMVPDEVVLAEWAKKNALDSASFEELCNNDTVKKMILKDATDLGKASGLKGFEQPKAIHLHHELFTPESGLLTPTMKTKRNEMQKYFQTEIDAMYKNAD